MIKINDAAKARLPETLSRNPGKQLRITIEGDGCAGPYFGISLDESVENEMILEVNGLKILVSEDVKRISELTTIKIFQNHIGKDLE